MTKEEYLLICLAEECAEVQQRICKALRFGLLEVQQSNPEETRDNRQRIAYELGDLLTVVSMLKGTHPEYFLSGVTSSKKADKLLKYMTYSNELGILE